MNNTDVLETVSAALNDYNRKTTESYLRLLEIGRAKIQVISRTMSSLSCKHNIAFTVIVHCYLLIFPNNHNLLILIRPPDLLLISQLLCDILATGFPFTPVGDEATTFAFYLFSAARQFPSAKWVKQFSCFISITQGTLLLPSLLWVPRTALQKKLKPMWRLVSCCPRINLWVWQHISPNPPSSEEEKQDHAGMCLHWSRNRPLGGSKCKRCVPSWYVFQYIILKAISHLSIFSEVCGLNFNGFEYIWKRLEDQRQNIFNNGIYIIVYS